ncbi:hypothetical protein LWI28_027866 [Acer negundo]|uniref:Uncharacterized protein n=1 Tax=Acer negundo TaxID=4023 RepID=A0AAD5NTH3_ACENE|nr:hypothetical protein LWI28_027866 [Acer negundo]
MLTTSNTNSPSQGNYSDPTWYMDSGATHHFTPEFGHLMDPIEFTGNEHAMVGNGDNDRSWSWSNDERKRVWYSGCWSWTGKRRSVEDGSFGVTLVKPKTTSFWNS